MGPLRQLVRTTEGGKVSVTNSHQSAITLYPARCYISNHSWRSHAPPLTISIVVGKTFCHTRQAWLSLRNILAHNGCILHCQPLGDLDEDKTDRHRTDLPPRYTAQVSQPGTPDPNLVAKFSVFARSRWRKSSRSIFGAEIHQRHIKMQLLSWGQGLIQ